MVAKKNLVNLAKGSKATTAKSSSKVGKKLTPKEERDLKAKEKVRELLDDVPVLKQENKETLLELDTSNETKKGGEWLEEQVSVLTEKNELLEKEARDAKADYKKLFEDYQKLKSGGQVDDSIIKGKVIELFNELQNNYNKLGNNFIVYFPAFLNRLILFFPFLKEHKRY